MAMASRAPQYQIYLDYFVTKVGNGSFFSSSQLSEIASGSLARLQKWNASWNRDSLSKWAKGRPFRDIDFREFSKLALYDIHVLIDDSGSMSSTNNQARWRSIEDNLQVILGTINHFSGGMTVHFLQSRDSSLKLKPDSNISEILNAPKNGSSKLGTIVKRDILSKILGKGPKLDKPCLVYIITDGEATGEAEDELKTTIADCKQTLGLNRNAIVFGLILVGLDTAVLKETREFWGKQSVNGALFHVSIAAITRDDLQIERAYVRNDPTIDLVKLALNYNILGPISA